MPDNTPKDPKEMSSGAKYALIGTLVTAVVGLIGTGLTLYFNYLEKVEPQKLALQATQTAEARLTQAAMSITPTPTITQTATATPVTPTITFTPTPALSFTPTFTPTLSPTATQTITPTVVVSGEKYCVDVPALNVRTGPSQEYITAGIGLFKGDCLAFDGYVIFDGANYWARISPGQPGYLDLGGMWVYANFLRPQDFEQRLPALPPPPPPPTPTPTWAG